MSDLKNLRNRPFLIVKTVQRPNSDINTSKRGWAETPRNWTMFERVAIKDRVPNRDLNEATVIVDLMRSEVVTSRLTGKTDDEIVQHYLETYRGDCKRAIEIWLNKVATRMAADPSFAAGRPAAPAGEPVEADEPIEVAEILPATLTVSAAPGDAA